ncbi:MAG: hypothetical protein GY853_01850 [PVC group bacterium]|nr:hypothetical protein [PVC group bacterium]
MFDEFQNVAWTPSDAGLITIADNTDTSVSGACTSLVFASAANEYVDFTFTGVDLSQWQEVVLWLYMRDQLTADNVLRITIDGTNYDLSRADIVNAGKWKQILFDCTEMGTVYSIRFTSLVANLTLFVDYVGHRKVGYDMDVDVIKALKAHISLDYDVATTLSADVSAGATDISVDSIAYITDKSLIELEDASGNIEPTQIESREGTTLTMGVSVTGTYSEGDEVRITCPVRSEDFDELEPDPVCGINVYDRHADRTPDILQTENGPKYIEYLGSLGIIIYIDCSNKKKLLQLSREFDNKYGKGFVFLLDGDKVTIYLEDSVFSDSIIGNNPRMAYYYFVEPQPYSQSVFGTTGTLTVIPQSLSTAVTIES